MPSCALVPGENGHWIAYPIGGLAHDGTQYVQVFERDSDSLLDIRTFDTLADLTSGTNSSLAILDFYSDSWSLGGLAYEKGTAVPEPSTLGLYGIVVLVLVQRWRRRTN